MDAAMRSRLRKLEISAMRLVNTRFLGEWSSNVRGQGLDFLDLREYVPGDDVRHLDWKATARSGRAQLRRFTEDRQQTIWIAIDLSASMAGAKDSLARELVAVLGWAAIKQGDLFGVVGFTDRIEIFRQPARGEAQLWASLEDILSHTAHSPKTSLSPVWDFCSHHLNHRSTIIVISDFRADLDNKALGTLAARHEILAFRVSDPRDSGKIDGRLAPVTDSETGERSWIDFSLKGLEEKLSAEMEQSGLAIKQEFRRHGAWFADFVTDRDFLAPLMEFFHRRREVIGA